MYSHTWACIAEHCWRNIPTAIDWAYFQFKFTNLLMDSFTYSLLSLKLQSILAPSSLLADNLAPQLTEQMEAMRREHPQAPTYLHLCLYSLLSPLYSGWTVPAPVPSQSVLLDTYPFHLKSSLFPSTKSTPLAYKYVPPQSLPLLIAKFLKIIVSSCCLQILSSHFSGTRLR